MSLLLPTVETALGPETAIQTVSAGSLSNCANVDAETIDRFQRALGDAFAEPFTLVNVETGECMESTDCNDLSGSILQRLALLAEVARRGTPEIVEDVSPLVMLAIPLPVSRNSSHLVAVGLFAQLPVEHKEQMLAAAEVFGVDADSALSWMLGREIWSPRVLLQLATAITGKLVQQSEVVRLRNEINEAVGRASDAYIELGLLHRLTRNLHLSDSASELWKNALVWLSDSVQAECLVIVANQAIEDFELSELFSDEVDGIWKYGDCPLETSALRELIERLGTETLSKPLVLNQAETSRPTWNCPEVRELVCVPIKDGEQSIAWLLAINHNGKTFDDQKEFSSVEQRLLSSVGTILGIHSCNFDLYRKQSELVSSLVRSMTSALDAKDRYTSGHSDRVAKMSVAIAEHLGLDQETIDTIQLGGLLHDIGKIGVDDTILNKPGKLTEEEFEHIKQHPQFGCDILGGIRQLDKILPIVLHHHENWDGTGYPHGLAETEIPLTARVLAVADAYDAMSSNRPYRDGLPDEKIDGILLEGAGSQWDATVVDAFFAIRDEINRIVSESSLPETSREAVLALD